MTTNVINWGILGTSPISEVMASAIQTSSTSRLIAIGGRSIEKARTFAQKFSITKSYDNYFKLLDDPDINAIYIGLPNHLHKEWIINAAQAGKHILCEKPFVISVNEMREVIRILEKSNVFCMEALMYRCHPFTKKLKELVQSAALGRVRLYHAAYTAHIADVANPIAGGSIRNLGCYPISLIRLLANAEPISIKAMGRFHEAKQTDHQASVLLQFQDQSMAVISTADDLKMSWHLTVYGTNGKLEVISNPWLPGLNNQVRLFHHDNEEPEVYNLSADKPLYVYQIDTVSQSVLTGNFASHEAISLQDSLGNVIVLEEWLSQVRESSCQEQIVDNVVHSN